MKLKFLVLSAAILAVCAPAGAKVTLPSLFSDNMVLQRNSSPEFRGTASPGQTVTITPSWNSRTSSTVASQTGEWRLRIETPDAGGPYAITISDGEPMTLNNVLVGEVWFCSGQSNMTFNVGEGVYGMEEAFAEASGLTGLRVLNIETGMSPKPSEKVVTVDGDGWELCSKESISDFSATAYYFGKELWLRLGIPVGLIHSSWGGTEIEGWISGGSLSQIPLYSADIEKFSKYPDDRREWENIYFRELNEWIASAEKAEKQFFADKGIRSWAYPDTDESSWRDVTFPGFLQDQVPLETACNGFYYCRKTFEIPAAWAGKNLTLHMSSVDDRDITFFNGTEIGRGEYYLDKRTYRIPGKLVKKGTAVIGVRILDNAGKCSIGGENDHAIFVEGPGGERIDLSGTWKFQIPQWQSFLPRVPYRTFIGPNIPSFLYNAMVNPMVNYPIKGAIWYQGEANLGFTSMYGDLLPLLIMDWRKAWGLDFDFYICNLHNYIEVYTDESKSRYAEMREVQSRTVNSLDHCGEAILLDVGDPYDTHPKNKAAVGHRLALQALAKSYGHDVVCDGPRFSGYSNDGRTITLSFTDLADGLATSDGKAPRGFTVAGPDRVFHKAEARIEGDCIVVECPEVEFPLAVRYAWHDNPDCNVVNSAGLPMGSFRTDNWELNQYLIMRSSSVE